MILEENGTKPLLEGHEGMSYDEFRVSRSSKVAIFSRILYLYKYLLQRSCSVRPEES